MNFLHLLKSFLQLFFPKLCVGCSNNLIESEEFFCLNCCLDLPKTNYHLIPNNLAYERFLGKVPIQKATAYLYYNKDGLGQKIVAAIKYQSNIRLGNRMGAYLAKEMLSSGFFADIDYLIPVPLHKKKMRTRGFNQSDILAQGIAQITNLPIENKNLYRSKFNITQTQKGVYERWQNTQFLFDLKNKELFNNKHILLVDDVLTTGSTLEACIQALLKTKNIKISILTLAIA
jgi:ComF family protein